ncbi:MAG: lysoplasmalogenase [Bacteroidota bacterium]
MSEAQIVNKDLILEKFNRFYGIIFVGVLVAHFDIPSIPVWPVLLWILKPLIMTSLGYLFLKVEGPNLDRKGLIFLGAIIASFLGDVVLLFKGELAFLLGLAAFLLAQVMYAWVFAQEGSWRVFREIGILFLLGYAVGLIHFLWPHLEPNIRLPIVMYAATISIMGICALSRKSNVSRKSFGWVVIGAFFFILSDSILALHRFAIDIPLRQYSVMATYMLAQYLIIIGYLRR